MNRFYFSSVLFFLITLCACCKKKCPDPVYNYYYLSTEEKNFVPYSGNETLKFASNLGDTVIFYGQGRFSEFQEYQNITQCHDASDYMERYDVYFNCDTPEINIHIDAEHNASNNAITISNASSFYFSFYSGVKNPNLNSVTFNGVTYYDVYYFSDSGFTENLHYTKKDGIIHFVQRDGKQWTLLK